MDERRDGRISRRRFLSAAGLATGAAMALSSWRRARAADTPEVAVWTTTPGAGAGESSVMVAPAPFNAVGALWQGTVADLAVRVRVAGDWSDWLPVHCHDGVGRDTAPIAHHGELIATAPADAVQYRATSDGAARLTLVLLDTAAGPAPATTPSALARQGVMAITAPYGGVYRRRDWGCNETYRFSNGQLVWPPDYQPVQKIIIHHTVTANQDPDPAATIRAIYYYHAVVLGWGDIGYNLLIDENGNVYEGRFGGVGVIGAHAKDFNSGTVGIALLGAFDSQYVSAAAERALAGIVSGTFGNLAPFGASLFNNVMLPTIAGHRDCLSTNCPGGFAYQQLPNFRDSVARAVGQARAQAQLTDFRVEPQSLDGRTLRVSVTVWNNSASTVTSQGPDPGFVYREGQNTATIGHLGQFNCWRVGVDLLDNMTGNLLPYRWGLGGALRPGESRTITGVIQLSGPKSSWAWAGLVQEGVAYRINQFAVSRVLTPGAGLRQVFVPIGVRSRTVSGG